jgi:NAD(P)-dependent dehydrogenase (short-subunit alcohol dehydrogenase family)
MSEQRIALVTGSGRGIGRGIALQLAQDGYTVIVNGVSEAPSLETKKQIEAAGGRAEVVRADIGSGEGRACIIEAVDALGRLDLLVNNAGVAPNVRADMLDAGEESFDRLIGINLKGPYFLTQALAKRMIEWKAQGVVTHPRIAFITSISAYTLSTNRGDYCISKAGLSMAATLFADRLAEYDIPVIEIRPGIIETDMTAGVKGKYDAMLAEGVFPQRRWGTPADVARLVGAFARGDLDYSTGAAIDVSGGFNLRRL